MSQDLNQTSLSVKHLKYCKCEEHLYEGLEWFQMDYWLL